jgi:plasmid maintenance system antidote protein VapI
MTTTEEFLPRWASPPGDTIRSALADLGMGVDGLADRLKVDVPTALGLLDGSTHLSLALARRLGETFGGSTTFWMTRETQYRESLDWVEADRWVSLLPRREMVNLGWLAPADDWHGWVAECMALFDVQSPAALNACHSTVEHARFRARPRTAAQSATIAAWLGKAESDAKAIDCEAWDPDGFRDLLPQLAALSRNPDPGEFVPELQQSCAAVGVAVVVLRAPRNCPVSGVSLVLPSGARVIGLSARYLADDHFWFTFFHEVAHLLLHDPSAVYVDDIEAVPAETGASGPEAEADQFAAESLLAPHLRGGAPRRTSPIQVHGLAHRAGVSPGVVVGQLQHTGHLSYKSPLNRLKHRYAWDGATLIRGSA